MKSWLNCSRTDTLHSFEELFNFPYWYKLHIRKQLSASPALCQTESFHLKDDKPQKFKVATTVIRF